MPGGNQRPYVLKQTCSFSLRVCLSINVLLPSNVEGLKTQYFYYSKNANKRMLTNAKITIYPLGFYLLKANNKNFRARCVNCSKLTKKDTRVKSGANHINRSNLNLKRNLNQI